VYARNGIETQERFERKVTRPALAINFSLNI